MKRLIYISHATQDFTQQEIQEIGFISNRNNKQNEITGVLLFIKGIFFQILEGKAQQVDEVYSRILNDPRHNKILCLKAEEKLTDRLFPDWSMQLINLDDGYNDVLFYPIKTLLQTLTESFTILEKYTPLSVINQFNKGINPLKVPSQIIHKIVFFSDIYAFSSLTERLPVSDVVMVVNHYLNLVTQIVTTHQGEVFKFIGDSVMAAFEADQADNAIQAALAVLNKLHQSRLENRENPLGILYAGIGLSYGSVIEGNIGSSLKMDYTLLGDAVNVAARIEGLTRQLPYFFLCSQEVVRQCQQGWNFVDLGSHALKGKAELMQIYSLDAEYAKKPTAEQQVALFIQQQLDRIA